MIEQFEKLVAAGIELVPAAEIATHFIFRRGLYAALVERRGEGFGEIGSAGLLTERGLAPLVLRGERRVFVAKDFEREATDGEIREVLAFSADLRTSLA